MSVQICHSFCLPSIWYCHYSGVKPSVISIPSLSLLYQSHSLVLSLSYNSTSLPLMSRHLFSALCPQMSTPRLIHSVRFCDDRSAYCSAILIHSLILNTYWYSVAIQLWRRLNTLLDSLFPISAPLLHRGEYTQTNSGTPLNSINRKRPRRCDHYKPRKCLSQP